MYIQLRIDMRFEWDSSKAEKNLKAHKLSFELATYVFDDPCHCSRQDRVVGGEPRWQTIGLVGNVALILVAHTVRVDEEEEIIRIISARKAESHERRAYEEGDFS